MSKRHLIELDFSRVQFVRPTVAVYFAFWLRHVKSQGNTNIVVPEPSRRLTNVESYLLHIGFWRFLENGCDLQSRIPVSGKKYLPFTSIKLPQVTGFIESKNAHEEIKRLSYKLAAIITRNEEPAFGPNRALAYGLRETIRNVLEHAETDTCIVSGQNWENGNSEIVIADSGIGIVGSLKSTISISDSKAALQEAIRPGVSSKFDDSEWNDWANTGFGLFMLSEIGRRLGKFLLMSDGSFIWLGGNRTRIGQTIQPQGTLVALQFGYVSNLDFVNLIDEIRQKGESIVSRSGRNSAII
jgi:hypothetical protein